MEKFRILTERLIVRIPDEKDINDVFLMMSDEYTAINTGFRSMHDISEAEGKIKICLSLQSKKTNLKLLGL